MSVWIIYGETFSFEWYKQTILIENAECNGSLKTEQGGKGQKQKNGSTSKSSPKTCCFVNETTQTSLATSNTYNSNINVDIPQ